MLQFLQCNTITKNTQVLYHNFMIIFPMYNIKNTNVLASVGNQEDIERCGD